MEVYKIDGVFLLFSNAEYLYYQVLTTKCKTAYLLGPADSEGVHEAIKPIKIFTILIKWLKYIIHARLLSFFVLIFSFQCILLALVQYITIVHSSYSRLHPHGTRPSEYGTLSVGHLVP